MISETYFTFFDHGACVGRAGQDSIKVAVVAARDGMTYAGDTHHLRIVILLALEIYPTMPLSIAALLDVAEAQVATVYEEEIVSHLLVPVWRAKYDDARLRSLLQRGGARNGRSATSALPAAHLPPHRDAARNDPPHTLRREPHLLCQRDRRRYDRPLLDRWLPEMERLNMNDTFRGDNAHLVRGNNAPLESAVVHFEEIEVPA